MQRGTMWQGQERELEALLAERFHRQTPLEPGQRELVEWLVRGERVLFIEGSEQQSRLCYLLASVCLPHLTLVCSPHETLVFDEWRRCSYDYEIPCALISAGKSLEEQRTIWTQALAGTLKILFFVPEWLDGIDWQRYLTRLNISLLVIEQADCISSHGSSFRPHYRRIVHTLASLKVDTPALLLALTATRCVETDIVQQLRVTKVVRNAQPWAHLCLHVMRLHGDWEKLCSLASILEGREGTGLVYTATQGSALMIATFLCSRGMAAVCEQTDRKDAIQIGEEQDLKGNAYSVLCSASIPANGLPPSDIRFVIHYHAPDSLSDYYRDIARAAHNRSSIWCILLYDPADIAQQEQHIVQDAPRVDHYSEVLTLLHAHSQGAHENTLLLNTGLSRAQLHIILDDLLAQKLVTFNEDAHRYALSSEARTHHTHKQATTAEPGTIDFSTHEQIRRKKLEELVVLQHYTHTAHCYMAYLKNYLGDVTAYERCGVCSNCNRTQFPDARAAPGIQTAVTQFLENDFLPRIEQQGEGADMVHKAGWSLAYHSGSCIGLQVHACKYQGAGPFPLGLVFRATEIASTRYPVKHFQGVVSVTPTESGPLVELFARQVAARLGSPYWPCLIKTRPTHAQRHLTNRVQKANNVRGVFAVTWPEKLVRCTLLLIDDVYDSGCTLYAASKALMEAGAEAVYPLTITRTLHIDQERGG